MAEQCLKQVAPDKSNWNALVQRYTDDDTKERPSGTIGLVGNGDLPVQLERAIVETPIGGVNPEVIESPFGFHVLWRVR